MMMAIVDQMIMYIRYKDPAPESKSKNGNKIEREK